jgi:hypothetical protein
MRLATVCKNVIASNNKRKWENPDPAIRLGKTKSSPAIGRGHEVAIHDAEGNVVARIISSTDGKPVVRCGAKVAIVAEHDMSVIS